MATLPRFFRFLTVFSILDGSDHSFVIKFYLGTGPFEKGTRIGRKIQDNLIPYLREIQHEIPAEDPEIMREADKVWDFQHAKMYELPQKIRDLTFPPTYVIKPETFNLEEVTNFVRSNHFGWYVIKRGAEKSVRVVARQTILDDPYLYLRGEVPGYVQKFVQSKLYQGPLPTETEPERLGCIRSTMGVLCDGGQLKITHFQPLLNVAALPIQEGGDPARIVSVRNQGAYLLHVPSGDSRKVLFKAELAATLFLSSLLGFENLPVASTLRDNHVPVGMFESLQYHDRIAQWKQRRQVTPNPKTLVQTIQDKVGG